MISAYRITSDDVASQSREQALARKMGKPPLPCAAVPESRRLDEFLKSSDAEYLLMIFDPEFWYPETCWINWLDAERNNPTRDLISLPLGNQNPGWRKGLDVPLYMTESGLEKASLFQAKTIWMYRQAETVQELCVFLTPRVILEQIPGKLKLKSIPEYLSFRKYPVRIYCHGWLHNFNALGDAGCRRDLLSMTEWKGLVLEMGCGSGFMAGTCKSMGNEVVWIGVDFDAMVIRDASEHVDLAVLADANHHLPFTPNVLFDRVVCADFLEHLPYPWEFLSALRGKMAQGGQLIASVPNVGHWSVVLDLMAGRFDELPAGNLCVTHLRFGTKISWGRWLKQSGWDVLCWEEERLPLPDNLKTFGHEYGLKTDRDSLETIRYRLLAEVR